MDAGVVNRRALRKMQADNGVRRLLTRAFAGRGLNQGVKVHDVEHSPFLLCFWSFGHRTCGQTRDCT